MCLGVRHLMYDMFRWQISPVECRTWTWFRRTGVLLQQSLHQSPISATSRNYFYFHSDVCMSSLSSLWRSEGWSLNDSNAYFHSTFILPWINMEANYRCEFSAQVSMILYGRCIFNSTERSFLVMNICYWCACFYFLCICSYHIRLSLMTCYV